MKPVIFGLSGPVLTPDEAALFGAARPAGYILFGRNIVDADQLRALTDSLRSLHGDDRLLISIDQEGGRVARMRPPHWSAFPAGEAFDRLYAIAPVSAIEAARANARALGRMLAEVGITMDLTPLLDLRGPDTHAAIGDRALGGDPMQVAALGRATIEGLRDAGVAACVKHMPGQGRAPLDSHLALPVVHADASMLADDIAPFAALAPHAAFGMTAHVVYPAWDADRCATMSPVVIQSVIRDTIGFDGVLMSDDLDMKALDGTPVDRAVGCIAAGCDVALNCWGRFDEMATIVDALPDMGDDARTRLARGMAIAGEAIAPFAEQVAQRDALLALA